jgi:hypothetical protein
MKDLLVHGVYDRDTLQTLREKGIRALAFDLRGRSANLVPFRQLQELLPLLGGEEVYLTFGDDKKETVLSFLNLLEARFPNVGLIFRDVRPAAFYQGLGRSFYWLFDPAGDWREILSLDAASGVLLPLRYQSDYQRLPELWRLVDERNLAVYLHAESFEQSLFVNLHGGLKLSIDLTSEVERSYRSVDQEKLRTMRLWRSAHANPAGQ